MLPQKNRVRTPADFSQTLRSGTRSGRRNVVVSTHRSDPVRNVPETPSDSPARAGFIVSKAVGNAVVRNKVKRRMRAVIAEELRDGGLLCQRPGLAVVIRALPAAAEAEWPQLRRDLQESLSSALQKMDRHG